MLSTSRPMGMVPGAIPLTEIAAFLDLHAMHDPETRLEWTRYLRALDDAYLAWWSEHEASKREAKKR